MIYSSDSNILCHAYVAVVFPRPAGKRIRAEDLSSDSDSDANENENDNERVDERADEPEEEQFESEEEGSFVDDEEDEEDEEDYAGSGSDTEVKEEGHSSSSSSRSKGDSEDRRSSKKDNKKRKKAKKEKKEKPYKPPKAKKSRYGKSIFLDEAEVGGSDEEEEEEEEVLREEQTMDHELQAIQTEAEARAATRHAANRRFQETSASDVVADIENRYRRQKGVGGQAGGYLGSAEGYMAETTRRSLVPGVNDPGEQRLAREGGGRERTER